MQVVLHEFKDVMSPKFQKKLPPRREVDHQIEFKQDVKPPTLVSYHRMTTPKLKELRK